MEGRAAEEVDANERTTAGAGAEQTYKHRARDAEGLADLRHYRFDTPRCREASRPVGPVDPTASRAPSVLFESGGCG